MAPAGSAGMERTEEKEAYSILTSRHHPDWPLQKSGHADLVETQDGEWYAVHLCGRPLVPSILIMKHRWIKSEIIQWHRL